MANFIIRTPLKNIQRDFKRSLHKTSSSIVAWQKDAMEYVAHVQDSKRAYRSLPKKQQRAMGILPSVEALKILSKEDNQTTSQNTSKLNEMLDGVETPTQ